MQIVQTVPNNGRSRMAGIVKVCRMPDRRGVPKASRCQARLGVLQTLTEADNKNFVMKGLVVAGHAL